MKWNKIVYNTKHSSFNEDVYTISNSDIFAHTKIFGMFSCQVAMILFNNKIKWSSYYTYNKKTMTNDMYSFIVALYTVLTCICYSNIHEINRSIKAQTCQLYFHRQQTDTKNKCCCDFSCVINIHCSDATIFCTLFFVSLTYSYVQQIINVYNLSWIFVTSS